MKDAMQPINSEAALKEAILKLESQRADEEKMLKEQFHRTYESYKPINLIKSIFTEVVESKDLKGRLLNTSVGLTAGFLSKVLFQAGTKSPLKKLLGTALMFGMTNVFVKNPEAVKSLGQGLLNIFKRKTVD